MKPVIVCEFRVDGHPETAGSKRAFVPTDKKTGQPYRDRGGRIIVNVVDDNPDSKAWKTRVALHARQIWGARPPLTAPLFVEFIFFRESPASRYGTGKNANVIKRSAPAFPGTRPDVLKLARAVEDAITGVVWVDDSQIVDERLSKRYGAREGVLIRIGTLPVTIADAYGESAGSLLASVGGN